MYHGNNLNTFKHANNADFSNIFKVLTLNTFYLSKYNNSTNIRQ